MIDLLFSWRKSLHGTATIRVLVYVAVPQLSVVFKPQTEQSDGHKERIPGKTPVNVRT